MKKILMIVLVVNGLMSSRQVTAQLVLSGQLRTRTELRDGYGAPLPEGARPAFFTSQRTRVSMGYSAYRLKLGLSVQDVRVWGQDISTINRTTTADNNGLMLHEAWAEIPLNDTLVKNRMLSLKLGRQELVYDDARLLGNLDWLQQGRRHDAAVLKFEKPTWQVHLAAAFNQNKENNAGTIYQAQPAGYAANTNNGVMYKSMQFLYASKKLGKGNMSYLFFADQFNRFHNDTLNQLPVKTYQNGSWNRFTTGLYYNNVFEKFGTTASAYYQFGKYNADKKVSAYLLTGFLHYQVSKSFNAGAGVDFTSGGSNAERNKSFDPLYGTPHKFWGLMDYFYAASSFGNTGLVDYYIKTRWKASARLNIAADLHQFNAASEVPLPGEPDNNKTAYGKELDLVGTFAVTRQIAIEAGYAKFFASRLLTAPSVKNIPNAQLNSNWAYVMISIKPEFLIK